MDILILLVVGAVVGWVAGLLMGANARPNAEHAMLLNVAVGIVGSAFGGLLLTPLLGATPITAGPISFASFVVSLLGAVILLATINLWRTGPAR